MVFCKSVVDVGRDRNEPGVVAQVRRLLETTRGYGGVMIGQSLVLVLHRFMATVVSPGFLRSRRFF